MSENRKSLEASALTHIEYFDEMASLIPFRKEYTTDGMVQLKYIHNKSARAGTSEKIERLKMKRMQSETEDQNAANESANEPETTQDVQIQPEALKNAPIGNRILIPASYTTNISDLKERYAKLLAQMPKYTKKPKAKEDKSKTAKAKKIKAKSSKNELKTNDGNSEMTNAKIQENTKIAKKQKISHNKEKLDIAFNIAEPQAEKKEEKKTPAIEKLNELKNAKQDLSKLREQGQVELADKKQQEDLAKKALAKATGEKVLDEKSLAKSIKKSQKKKENSSMEWKNRIDNVKKEQKERQQKREENINNKRNKKSKR